MAKIEDLAERVDRLVLRHQELKRTTALIAEQLVSVTSERDSLKSRLAAARARVDALLERLPTEDTATAPQHAQATTPQLVDAAQTTGQGSAA
jgi:cell division protein ZapB